MTSHTLEDPWRHYMILGRPLQTFFWALTNSWSRSWLVYEVAIRDELVEFEESPVEVQTLGKLLIIFKEFVDYTSNQYRKLERCQHVLVGLGKH